MTERALKTAPETPEMADPDEVTPESPATRLLDALRAGDDAGVLAEVGQTTTVMAENMPWACRGPDEVQTMLREARERFPGLTFESSTRHVGFGLVIEEARVRDEHAEAAAAEAATRDEEAETAAGDAAVVAYDHHQDTHPMWDEPAAERRAAEMSLWRERAEVDAAPMPLNMPVRVTVKHDDLQVHEVRLSFPAALLKRALGLHVDPLEMSLSEVQSAFIAPVGAGFTTHKLARPELTLVPPAPVDPPVAEPVPAEEPPRRRRRGPLLLLVALLVAAIAGGGWWVTQGSKTGDSAGTAPAAALTPAPTPTASTTPSTQPSSGPSSTQPPKVTRTRSTTAPVRKPSVTLKSDLAFGFNSATLSPQAKSAIDKVAREVRTAGLTGTIYVDGYTDNIGSAAYGLVLSERRATVVSNYLQSQLLGAPVSIVATGHGESHPIASNATTAGQKKNRRVTITLPKP
jgi:outer membrane protein OmpA-like peptidoglycan-associated protein